MRHRIVVHVDADAYFASIEQRDDPSLRGKAVAVGSKDTRGVIATASYEARKFGVHSALPTWQAMELCPHLIVVSPNFQKYKAASEQIMSVLMKTGGILEPVSIDEAYIDTTNNLIDEENPIKVAQWIKNEIKATIGITVTCGIGKNKFLAKTASNLQKPDGITHITDENMERILNRLPIEEFRGVGKKAASVFRNKGITNGYDLVGCSIKTLVDTFGESRAVWYYNIARGNDDREVISEKEERKSINLSQTYQTDITKPMSLAFNMWEVSKEIMEKSKMHGLEPRTMTLKVKYHDFTVTSRSATFDIPVTDHVMIFHNCIRLLRQRPLDKPVRLIGLSLSNFIDKETKLW